MTNIHATALASVCFMADWYSIARIYQFWYSIKCATLRGTEVASPTMLQNSCILYKHRPYSRSVLKRAFRILFLKISTLSYGYCSFGQQKDQTEIKTRRITRDCRRRARLENHSSLLLSFFASLVWSEKNSAWSLILYRATARSQFKQW